LDIEWLERMQAPKLGVAHLPGVERPREVNGLVLGFLGGAKV